MDLLEAVRSVMQSVSLHTINPSGTVDPISGEEFRFPEIVTYSSSGSGPSLGVPRLDNLGKVYAGAQYTQHDQLNDSDKLADSDVPMIVFLTYELRMQLK